MTGVDDPYEPPVNPEIEVDMDTDPQVAVQRVVAVLAERGVVV
jgi:adenylylsulfate kinase-like enzyme